MTIAPGLFAWIWASSSMKVIWMSLQLLVIMSFVPIYTSILSWVEISILFLSIFFANLAPKEAYCVYLVVCVSIALSPIGDSLDHTVSHHYFIFLKFLFIGVSWRPCQMSKIGIRHDWCTRTGHF